MNYHIIISTVLSINKNRGVERNYKKLQKKTYKIKYNKLRDRIREELIFIKCSNVDTHMEMIDNLYIVNLENEVTKFFNDIKYYNCSLFATIYITIRDFMKLETYDYKTMIKHI